MRFALSVMVMDPVSHLLSLCYFVHTPPPPPVPQTVSFSWSHAPICLVAASFAPSPHSCLRAFSRHSAVCPITLASKLPGCQRSPSQHRLRQPRQAQLAQRVLEMMQRDAWLAPLDAMDDAGGCTNGTDKMGLSRACPLLRDQGTLA